MTVDRRYARPVSTGGSAIRRWTVSVLAGSALLTILVVPALASGIFVDDDGNPHEPDIEALADADVTRGCDPPHDTRYCPYRAVTRGQIAAMLVRALGLEASSTDHFTDDDGSMFEPDINALADEEITNGCTRDETRYCPSQGMRRDQMAALLVRAQNLAPSDTDHFTDDDGSLFEPDINALADAEITTGCGDGTRYCPDDVVPRDQMAAFLARALQLEAPGPVPLHQPPDAPFEFSYAQVKGHPTVEDRVVGTSWRSGCPVGLEDLRYLRLSYVGFDGEVRTGELIVHASVVGDVRTAMRRTYEAGFPIRQMRLVSDFGADDDRSMRANNTSAFNCRKVAGTSTWSQHTYGRAIDINPLRNPWVQGSTVDPPEGRTYADRSDRRPGMLYAGDVAVDAWTDLGWGWGGNWSSSRDYQHFSESGR